MNVEFSGSDTPPLSDENENEETQIYKVKEKSKVDIDLDKHSLKNKSESFNNYNFIIANKGILDCTTSSYKGFAFLKSGYIKSLLENADVENPNSNNKVHLFGSTFTRHTALIDDKMRSLLFLRARQCVFSVINNATNIRTTAIENDSKTFRIELANFLTYCDTFVRQCPTDSEFCFSELLKDLGSLRKSIGNISQLPIHYWCTVKKLDCVHFCLCHMYYDIQLFEFTIAYSLLKRCGNLFRSEFHQIASHFMMDLTCMTFIEYTQKKQNSVNLWEVDFVGCTCLREIWIVLIVLLDSSYKTFSTESFWSLLSWVIEGLENEEERLRYEIHLENSNKVTVDFKMWLVANIAPLYWVDCEGRNMFSQMQILPGNWLIVQEWLDNYISNSQENEVRSNSHVDRCIFWTCFVLSKHWSLCPAVFNSLVMYYNKQYMNMELKPEKHTKITGFIQRDTSVWLKLQTMMNVLNEEPSCLLPQDTLFDLLLRYIKLNVSRAQYLGDYDFLKQIKSKIYTRYHKHRIRGLNATGVERVTHIFTFLGAWLNDEEPLEKIIALLSEIKKEDKTKYFLKSFIASHFTVLFCGGLSKLKTDTCMTSILKTFDYLVLSYREKKTKDKEQLNIIWELISFYFENVEECLNSILTNIEFVPFITSSYVYLVKVSSEPHRRLIFIHLKEIVNSQLLLNEPKLSFLTIHKNLIVPLESLSSHPVKEQIEFTAGVAIMSAVSLLPDGKEFFMKYLQKLLSTNDLSYMEKNIYICNILSSSPAIELLEQCSRTNDVITFWVDGVLECSRKSFTLITELTKSVLNFKTILKFVRQRTCQNEKDVKLILDEFIIGIGVYYKELNLNEVAKWRKCVPMYFGNLIKITESIIIQFSSNEMTSSDCLQTCFHVAGMLVKDCGRIIYSKTTPTCLLPQLIDNFVVPMNGKNPLKPEIKRTMMENVYLYLCGLSRLEFTKDEYIARKIKQIHDRYFVDACNKYDRGDTTIDTFMVALEESCSDSLTKQAVDYRKLVLHHIQDNFLYLTIIENLKPTLKFLHRLLHKTKSANEISKSANIFLTKTMVVVYVCNDLEALNKIEPPELRSLAMKILKILFTAQKQNIDSYHSCFKKFLYNNYNPEKGHITLKTARRIYELAQFSETHVSRPLMDLFSKEIDQFSNRLQNNVECTHSV